MEFLAVFIYTASTQQAWPSSYLNSTHSFQLWTHFWVLPRSALRGELGCGFKSPWKAKGNISTPSAMVLIPGTLSPIHHGSQCLVQEYTWLLNPWHPEQDKTTPWEVGEWSQRRWRRLEVEACPSSQADILGNGHTLFSISTTSVLGLHVGTAQEVTIRGGGVG